MAGQELSYLSKEQELINVLKELIGPKYLGDDCARIASNLLVSTDTLVEGNHFSLATACLYDIGWKAMAVNLSDIAAMAGRPRYALAAITVPANLRKQDFAELYKGIADCARTFQTAIVGGDITSGKALSLTVTVIGEVNEHGCMLRSSAKDGDVVIVSGHFGASAAGLAVLSGITNGCNAKRNSGDIEDSARGARQEYPGCVREHLRPVPRLQECWQLVEKTGSRGALMDASDGLADALAQIARASGVGMQIDLNAIPIDSETRKIAKAFNLDPYELALYGGEDYELVGTLPEPVWDAWLTQSKGTQPPFKPIGKVTSSGSVKLMLGEKPGPALNLQKCFQHIATGSK